MNTKLKFNRQVIVTICVLLASMWLPLTTFAQDFSKTGDLTQDANIRAENCAHCQTKHHSHDLRDCHHSHDALTFLPGSSNWLSDEIVGFAETDPTTQQSGDAVTGLQASNLPMQQMSVGFSESDPASHQALESMTVLSASNSLALSVSVGFSETDPAIDLNRSIGELRSMHLVDCLGGNSEGEVFVTPKFSNLTETGTQHEIDVGLRWHNL